MPKTKLIDLHVHLEPPTNLPQGPSWEPTFSMDGQFCHLTKVFNSKIAPGMKLAAHTSITFMKFLVVIGYAYKNVLLLLLPNK